MNKEEILRILNQYNLPKDEYIVIFGAALVLYDIKEKTKNIDIVVTPKLEQYLLKKYQTEIKFHNKENGKNIYLIDNIISFSTNLNEILENGQYKNQNGYNIQEINSIIKLKEKLGREKDLKDIEKIKTYQLLKNINVLALAYIGDSIYDIYIRKYLIKRGITKVNNLQKRAIKYVSASGQAKYLKQMIDTNFLTIQEIELVKRARNHKSHKCPKNTDVTTYKNATGIEALVGYLYLKEDKERLDQIMNFIVGD